MSYKLDKPYTNKEYADFVVEYNHNNGKKIIETQNALYALKDNEYLDESGNVQINPDYEEQKAQEEAQRVAMLNLRRGDVFRGLIKAKGITKVDIKNFIESMPATTEEEILAKELARIDFEDAVDFYRGNQLIDTIGLTLGISKEQLDEFFETNDYTKLITQETTQTPVEEI